MTPSTSFPKSLFLSLPSLPLHLSHCYLSFSYSLIHSLTHSLTHTLTHSQYLSLSISLSSTSPSPSLPSLPPRLSLLHTKTSRKIEEIACPRDIANHAHGCSTHLPAGSLEF